MSSEANLITKFKNSADKVGRINSITSAEMSAVLEQNRQKLFKLPLRVQGRKVKVLFFVVGSIATFAAFSLKYNVVYKELYDAMIRNKQKEIMPIFQMLEDRAAIIIHKRDQTAIKFALPQSKKYKELMEYSHRYLNGGPSEIVRSPAIISNVGRWASYTPVWKTFENGMGKTKNMLI